MKITKIFAAVVGSGALALASVGPATAASTSYIYTQPGHYQAWAMCESASCGLGRSIGGIRNGTAAHMLCWESGNTYNGNYATNRWFIVTMNGYAGEWWINASYVYYQTSVPHCP